MCTWSTSSSDDLSSLTCRNYVQVASTYRNWPTSWASSSFESTRSEAQSSWFCPICFYALYRSMEVRWGWVRPLSSLRLLFKLRERHRNGAVIAPGTLPTKVLSKHPCLQMNPKQLVHLLTSFLKHINIAFFMHWDTHHQNTVSPWSTCDVDEINRSLQLL